MLQPASAQYEIWCSRCHKKFKRNTNSAMQHVKMNPLHSLIVSESDLMKRYGFEQIVFNEMEKNRRDKLNLHLQQVLSDYGL